MRLPQFTKGLKREGFYQSKGGKDNSSSQVHNGREKDVILIGKVKQKITRGLERAQGMGEFVLYLLSKEAQSRLTHGCHRLIGAWEALKGLEGQVYQPPTNQPPVYQAPPQQMQGVSKTDFENYVKANDAVQTVTNPREHVNAITIRSGKTCEGPSTPLVPTPVVSTPLKEPEQNLETSMDKVQKPSLESTAQVPPPEEEDSIFIEIPKPKAKKTVNIEIQEPNSPKPTSYQPKLPYPERMKVRENDKPSAQHSRFLKMFKQLRLEIGLKDALIEMSKFNKWLSGLLRNKEKLEEIAITTVLYKELDRTNAFSDSGELRIKSITSFYLQSEPVQEEIDIFLVPDDLIPPGVKNDDSDDEDN
ncbi:hypothetical protein Tco_0212563 [Tanacetum coccineum]